MIPLEGYMVGGRLFSEDSKKFFIYHMKDKKHLVSIFLILPKLDYLNQE